MSNNVVFYDITCFLCVKSKNAQEQKWFKISTFMCMPSLRTIYENWRFQGPPPPWISPPSETRETSIFLFFSLYTAMVTKNKFFIFPARLTPPWLPVCSYYENEVMIWSSYYKNEVSGLTKQILLASFAL